MPISSPSFKPIVGAGAASGLVTNLVIGVINTEFSHTFQDGIKGFILRSREKTEVKISFTATESGTDYLTLLPRCVLDQDGLEFTGKSIYIQSPNTTVIEIVEFYT